MTSAYQQTGSRPLATAELGGNGRIGVAWLWKRAVPWHPQELSKKNYPPIVAALLTEALLYGVHLILFAICIYLLLSKRMRLQWLMFGGITIMFILATADVAISWHFVLHKPYEITHGTTITLLDKLFPKHLIFVSNNLIAVALLIARCYVVWGQKAYVPILAGVPLLIATGFGYAVQISNPSKIRLCITVSFIMTLVMNNILTLLTAGRIWWLSRRVSHLLGRRGKYQYRRTSAIIVESGLLYSLSMITLVAMTPTVWAVVGCTIVIRTVCIMPVIIVVQISVGHTMKPGDMEMTTGIHTGQTSPVLDTIVNTGGPMPSSSVHLTTGVSSIASYER